MPPLFETIKVSPSSLGFLKVKVVSQSFKDVPIADDGIDTACFLEAADGLALIFGKNPTLRFVSTS
jgi:hypothetical protein